MDALVSDAEQALARSSVGVSLDALLAQVAKGAKGHDGEAGSEPASRCSKSSTPTKGKRLFGLLSDSESECGTPSTKGKARTKKARLTRQFWMGHGVCYYLAFHMN
jgi:hypothetical protein